MNNLPEKIILLNKSLKELEENPSFSACQIIINQVINLLRIDSNNSWKLFVDSNGKIRSNASWFMMADGFADKRASYKIADENDKNIDIKAYWIRKTNESIISWLVALTPNFEDELFYKSKNIGIDFIISEKADRIIIALSNNYAVRTLELHKNLSLTQQEIFAKWLQDFNFENKAQVHKSLWDSFDLEPVNKTFYKGISSFFVELKQHLVQTKVFNEKNSAFFTNRLIGRIVFCWFLEKKGFINKEQKYFDIENKKATEYYKEKLEKLFFRTLNTEIKKRHEDPFSLIGGLDEKTPFLNGGLFTPKDDDYFGLKKIKFPADYFDRFYTFLNHYNFTTDESTSEFQQVAIDPEMLGRIFENLLAEQTEETGEQARKAKGAFYTPREIVDYMCKESLREYLKSKIKETDDRDQRIGQLLDSRSFEWRDQQRNYRDKLKPYKYEILKAFDNLRIIDPACGSGAFPMGMLQLLLQTYERLDVTFDPYKKKFEIIKNNIYGVDIEPIAVEIARLRVWLSIVVEEELSPKKENMGIEPLPNLDFKFVCANTLIPAPEEKQIDGLSLGFENDNFFEELEKGAEDFFNISDSKEKENKKLEIKDLINKKVNEKLAYIEGLSKSNYGKKYSSVIKAKNEKAIAENTRLMSLWKSYLNIFTSDSPVLFFEPKYFFPSVKDGFDVVIGNPPYVSTKGRSGNDKKILKDIFGFVDDLYSHFYFKGFEIIKQKTGILAFITSKTFWTIQTKKSIRELLQKNQIIKIFDTAAPFAAMVDTCVVIVKKIEKNGDYIFQFSDGKENISSPQKYNVNITLYKGAVNQVFFIPTKFNLQVYNKYNKAVKELMDEWWSKIETSKKISQNKSELKDYIKSLKAGDVALLGTLTEGGQGLATGNNGKYVGVLSSTKDAEKARQARIKKFFEFVIKQKINKYGTSKESIRINLNKLSEQQIRDLFDSMKEKYGRDIFGQGFLYQIIVQSEIRDVSKMTDDEKGNGLSGSQTFVPYDKGDKDGNRWYLRTPYYIEWSKENVKFLRNNSGKKGKGMPVMRNPQFYFRAGFCWTDVNSTYLKSRLNNKSVFDVLSMTMFTLSKLVSDKYAVCMINSRLISEYVSDFVNSTSHFQINDARQIPIIIPTKKQLADFEDLFDCAYAIKVSQFDGKMTNEIANQKLQEIQKELDKKVLKLYGLSGEEIGVVENK